MNPSANNFIKQIRENWFLIAFIGTIVIGWNTFSNRLSNVEMVQAEQKTDVKELTSQVANVNGAIIEIKANYIFIKSSLDRIVNK